MNPEERKLIEEAIKGDRQAWREIYVRYGKPIIERLHSLTINSWLDPEDIFQEACIRAFLAFQKGQFDFGKSKGFYGWIYTLALNSLRDELRRPRSKVHPLNVSVKGAKDIDSINEVEYILDIKDWHVLERLEEEELADIIQRAVQSLPNRDREIVELFYFHGFTAMDIAELLGLPKGNVRIILHRARKGLREILEANEAIKAYLD